MTINCTEIPFLCYSRIKIVDIELPGIDKFVGLLLTAFALQIASNSIWLQVSQVSRELLQYKRGDKKRCALICKNVGWTAIGTSIGILRVIFIIGNNLWLYLVILAGDVVGTAVASYVQSKDEGNTLDVFIKHLEEPRLSDKKKKIVSLLMPEIGSFLQIEEPRLSNKKKKIVSLLMPESTSSKKRNRLFL